MTPFIRCLAPQMKHQEQVRKSFGYCSVKTTQVPSLSSLK